MSETVTKKAKINNLINLKKSVACFEGAKYLGTITQKFYRKGTHTGHGVQLPGWKYPVIFDLQKQEQRMDQYEDNGYAWGSQEDWHKFCQEYAAATAATHQLSMGVKPENIQKRYLPNGKISIKVKVGSGLGVDGADPAGPGGYGVAGGSD